MKALGLIAKWVGGGVLAIILVGLGVFAYCEARKAYWDREVDQLCKKDGGLKVLEQVRLTSEEFERLGGIDDFVLWPDESTAGSKYPFVTETSRTVIHNWNPEVYRRESIYKYKSSGKVLARAVSYNRIGGDFPFYDHPSNYSCPEISALAADERRIVLIDR